MGIPKQLHQIWIGPDDRPNDLIKTWQDKHQDWPHFVWDERAINNEIVWTSGARQVYDQYMQDERFCGAANVARVLILHQYGGVYVDADMRCRHTLEGAWFMDHNNWISQSPHDPTRSQNAAMAGNKYSPFLTKYVEKLNEIGERGLEIHPSWQRTGALLIDSFRNQVQDDVGFVSSPAFFSRQKNGNTNPALWTYTGIMYADHFFYSTHGRRMSA